MERAVPLLVFTPEICGIIRLNDSTIGEAGPDEPLTAPISPHGTYYISLEPLYEQPGTVYSTVTRKLSFLDNKLVLPVRGGNVSVGQWPDNVYQVNLRPHALMIGSRQVDLPHRLCQSEWNLIPSKPYIVTVFHEDGLNVAIEDKMSQKLIFLQRLKLTGENVTLSFESISGSGYNDIVIRIASEKQRGLCVIGYLEGRLQCIFEAEADSFEIGHGSISLVIHVDNPCGMQIMEQWELSQGLAMLMKREPGFFTRERSVPDTERQTIQAFLWAMRYGNESEAMGYIHSRLKPDLTFGDLKDFLGSFECVLPPFWEENCGEGCTRMALSYPEVDSVYNVRVFCFDLLTASDGHSTYKIENIREN